MHQTYVLSELEPGERVISERLSHVRSVAIGFWIGAGSRDEPDPKAGVSHFIEHLLFKGTASYSAQEIAEIFDALGGELNAATSREHTVVYARVPDDRLETALDVMGEMVFAPAFAELDAEREVVLEEIAMYEDQPQELVHDLISEATFGSHPLGRPVIGRAEVISSVSRRTLSSYHRSMYVPGNVVVAAAGNLKHEELQRLLLKAQRKAVAPVRKGPRVRPPLVKPPAPIQNPIATERTCASRSEMTRSPESSSVRTYRCTHGSYSGRVDRLGSWTKPNSRRSCGLRSTRCRPT